MTDVADLARATDRVQLEADHEQMVLRWKAPGALRAAVAGLGLLLAASGVGTLAYVGLGLLTSPLFCMVVALPLVLAVGLLSTAAGRRAGRLVRRSRGPMALAAMAIAAVLFAAAGRVTDPLIASLEFGLAATMLAASAWLVVEAWLSRRPHELGLSTRELRLGSERETVVVPLETIREVRRRGNHLVVHHDHGEVAFGHWLGRNLLDQLAASIHDAVERRQANLGEERPPPDALSRLWRAAGKQADGL